MVDFKKSRAWLTRWAVGMALLAIPSAAIAQEPFWTPASGQISSPFGWRMDPINGTTRFHGGIDIAAASGMPVYAPQPGRVVYSGAYGGYGNVVVLDHGNTLYTLYGHNSQLLVQAGQWIQAGQLLARVGSTGHSTGPHLHFEVHYNQQYISPLTYLSTLQQTPLPHDLLAQAQPQHATITNVSRSTQAGNRQASSQSSSKTYRRHYPQSAYGRRVVQLVNGTDIETVEF